MKIPLFMFKDSKSLFDTITKHSQISEKRLLVDMATIRDGYRRKERKNIGFIKTNYNIADTLTKGSENETLDELLYTGILQHPVSQ